MYCFCCCFWLRFNISHVLLLFISRHPDLTQGNDDISAAYIPRYYYNNIYIITYIYINIDYYCCDTYCWCCYYDVLHLQKNGTLSRMCPLSCCAGWHSSTFFRVTISIFDWWGIFRAVIYIHIYNIVSYSINMFVRYCACVYPCLI